MNVEQIIKNIKELIAENRIKYAIELMLKTCENTELFDQIVLQSAKYANFEKQIIDDLLSTDEKNIQYSKIINALLQIVDKFILIQNTTNDFIEKPDLLKSKNSEKLEFIRNEKSENNNGIIIGKIESNNSPVKIENIQGDKVIIYKEQDINEHLDLKFSKINVSIPYGYILNAIDENNKKYSVYAQPKSHKKGMPNSHSQDIVLTFDVTNPNKSEIRIIDLYIEVKEFHSVKIIKISPVASAGETRKYFCNIEPIKQKYICNKLFKHDYIKISQGELEHFGVNVNTTTAGIYLISICLKYSFNGNEIIRDVGQVDRHVGFY